MHNISTPVKMRPTFMRLMAVAEPPAMAHVRQALKGAMRSGDVMQKNTLRAVMAAVKNANIAKQSSCTTDLAFAGVLNSLIKKRVDAAQEYLKGERQDLADNEQAEAKILAGLIEQLDIAKPEEVEGNVRELLARLEDKSFKNLMSNLPKNVEGEWRAPRSTIVAAARRITGMGHQQRRFTTAAAFYSHENPLGLRRRSGNNHQQRGPRPIPDAKKVLLVSSAKGGVGKSTVAVNLGIALSQRGFNVGILDVDIFGPSLPHMLGLSSVAEPQITSKGHIMALQNYGVRAMSMGFLIPPGRSVSWRGLLVQKALQQLLFEVDWGAKLDYLVVDMPPGTGDVQLTIAQQVKVDGAILVSTPQDVALIDAVRGLDMFRTVHIPVLGLVQNMSVFICPCCQTPTRIFGPTKPAVNGLDILAEIPMKPEIAASLDAGAPLPQDPVYLDLADNIVHRLTD